MILVMPINRTEWNALVLLTSEGVQLSFPVQQLLLSQAINNPLIDPDVREIVNQFYRFQRRVYDISKLITKPFLSLPQRVPYLTSFEKLKKFPFSIERMSILPFYYTQLLVTIKNSSKKLSDFGGGCKQTEDPLPCFFREMSEELPVFEFDPNRKGLEVLITPGFRKNWAVTLLYPVSEQYLNYNSELSSCVIKDYDKINPLDCEPYTFIEVMKALHYLDWRP